MLPLTLVSFLFFKTRKDKLETVERWGTQDKKGQTRDSRNMGYTRQERTPETVETWGTKEKKGHQSQWKHGVHKTRKDKPETVETLGTQDKKGQTRDSRNMGYTRQERTTKRQ
jgi:hypothetical protein